MISHRLCAPISERSDDGINASPKRIVFLSVEGTKTEISYFTWIHRYREALNIRSVVHLSVLLRYDTESDPDHVLALLTDYLNLREEGITAEQLHDLLPDPNGFTLRQIQDYLDGTGAEHDRMRLDEEIRLKGIERQYRYQKELSDYQGESDVFAIVIDRDCQSHTAETLMRIFQQCEAKGVSCFLTNPCFEFWLLLHVCDIDSSDSELMDKLLQNKKISNKHTYVSKMLSEYARHSKKITEEAFCRYYLPNVDSAIARADHFPQKKEKLLTQVGSNLPQLFRILREELST